MHSLHWKKLLSNCQKNAPEHKFEMKKLHVKHKSTCEKSTFENNVLKVSHVKDEHVEINELQNINKNHT